jgi:Transglutaminase-like superfamily
MWKTFQRYRELDAEARKLFWRAAILLPLASVSLRLRGFQRTKEKLSKKLLPPVSDAVALSGQTLQKTCRMVNAAAHYGFGHPTCLEQSLVLWYLLREQNIPAQFRIGVRKSREKFEAHAWVEHDGIPLNQTAEAHQHYTAFESEFSNVPGGSA